MTRSISIAVSLCAFLAAACVVDEPVGEEERGGLGKADAYGSCSAEDCGGPASEGICWCDELCAEYDDCCSNKAEVCDPAPGCETNADCAEGWFCSSETCEGLGECAKIPDPGTVMCGMYAGPYCACNGETRYTHSTCVYDRIDHWGACDPEVSCMTNADCQSGEYCEAAGCEGFGVCQEIPDPGTVMCGMYAGPYCACDGETRYTNSTCVYERVDHWGSCEPEPASCMTNADCQGGEFCEAAGCLGYGVCQEIPEPGTVMCGMYAGPYCACDGETRYTNSTCVYERVDHWGTCEG